MDNNKGPLVSPPRASTPSLNTLRVYWQGWTQVYARGAFALSFPNFLKSSFNFMYILHIDPLKSLKILINFLRLHVIFTYSFKKKKKKSFGSAIMHWIEHRTLPRIKRETRRERKIGLSQNPSSYIIHQNTRATGTLLKLVFEAGF